MTVSRGRAGGDARESSWVFTCEHGGCAVPREYGTLGLARADLRDHIGWDVGAAAVMKAVAEQLGAPSVASKYSRLLVDCNRTPDEASLIPQRSDGRMIPANAKVTKVERRRRLALYHEPYHDRVDRMVARARREADGRTVRLLSLHSFTPAMDGRTRRLDMGVLFDDHEPLARGLGLALKGRGFIVRYNQPYSGLDGLIYAARRHGRAHGIGYVELEINNALIRTDEACRSVAAELAAALDALD
ncbi:MAG: N-formylglutamate amidohydrolase [Candidatus Binatia bacterium]|nr:N-formylglutamate amidohydrolase [Candidatus Binatia bacterium]